VAPNNYRVQKRLGPRHTLTRIRLETRVRAHTTMKLKASPRTKHPVMHICVDPGIMRHLPSLGRGGVDKRAGKAILVPPLRMGGVGSVRIAPRRETSGAASLKQPWDCFKDLPKVVPDELWEKAYGCGEYTSDYSERDAINQAEAIAMRRLGEEMSGVEARIKGLYSCTDSCPNRFYSEAGLNWRDGGQCEGYIQWNGGAGWESSVVVFSERCVVGNRRHTDRDGRYLGYPIWRCHVCVALGGGTEAIRLCVCPPPVRMPSDFSAT